MEDSAEIIPQKTFELRKLIDKFHIGLGKQTKNSVVHGHNVVPEYKSNTHQQEICPFIMSMFELFPPPLSNTFRFLVSSSENIKSRLKFFYRITEENDKKNTVKPKFKIFLQSENTKTCEVCRHVTPTASEPNSILQAESLDGHFDMLDDLRVVSVTFTNHL